MEPGEGEPLDGTGEVQAVNRRHADIARVVNRRVSRLTILDHTLRMEDVRSDYRHIRRTGTRDG